MEASFLLLTPAVLESEIQDISMLECSNPARNSSPITLEPPIETSHSPNTPAGNQLQTLVVAICAIALPLSRSEKRRATLITR
ncbi:hypothetical protein Bca4012_039900 [Brassica carinata]|uniref:Uncharacterized protein n=1 Tax=Brassica carinata TaxID=52824 RepID=A0A8X7W973_BRACI|nr:hypothetical protein Bca52824_008134 [Brassica carinata]